MLKVAYADEPSKPPSYINASVPVVSQRCERNSWNPFPLSHLLPSSKFSLPPTRRRPSTTDVLACPSLTRAAAASALAVTVRPASNSMLDGDGHSNHMIKGGGEKSEIRSPQSDQGCSTLEGGLAPTARFPLDELVAADGHGHDGARIHIRRRSTTVKNKNQLQISEPT